jgi:ion channel POLLUX/CASTOR
MEKPTLKQIIRYRLDNFMSKGGKAIFTSLFLFFIATLVLVMIVRSLIMSTGVNAQHEGDWFHHLYIAFLEMTDPGNMAQDIDSSPLYKIPSILAGLAGIILLSMLIGFITTVLVKKLEDLRKGHSKVIEEGHSLILGWSDQRVVEILKELIMANESEDDPAVVILADKPKEEMDDYLNLALPESERANTRIVTRSGSTSSLINLQIAAVDSCRRKPKHRCRNFRQNVSRDRARQLYASHLRRGCQRCFSKDHRANQPLSRALCRLQ